MKTEPRGAVWLSLLSAFSLVSCGPIEADLGALGGDPDVSIESSLTGCTSAEQAACGAFKCGCLNGLCSGGSCAMTYDGCSAAQRDSCAASGCGCLNNLCSGGSCVRRTDSCTDAARTACAAFTCGCQANACAGGACAPPPPPARYDNPVAPDLPGWGGPNVVRGPDGLFYSLGTQPGQRVKQSKTLFNGWRELSVPTFVNSQADGAPSWALNVSPRFMGTELHHVRGAWVMVSAFTRLVGTRKTHVIALASSTTGPTGPYTWVSKPVDVLHSDENHVDPSLFVDGPNLWLLYNVSYVSHPNNKKLKAVKFQSTSFLPDSATEVDLLSTTVDPKAWENDGSGQRLEAPGMFKYNGVYYLHYAAGEASWSNQVAYPYVVGLARSNSMPPQGLFEKKANPVLGEEKAPRCSGTCWKGPGHGSVIRMSGGAFYFFYQAKRDTDSSKTAFLQEMFFDPSTKWFRFEGAQIKRTGNIQPVP